MTLTLQKQKTFFISVESKSDKSIQVIASNISNVVYGQNHHSFTQCTDVNLKPVLYLLAAENVI